MRRARVSARQGPMIASRQSPWIAASAIWASLGKAISACTLSAPRKRWRAHVAQNSEYERAATCLRCLLAADELAPRLLDLGGITLFQNVLQTLKMRICQQIADC